MNKLIESYLKQHYCRDYFNAYGETVEDDHYFMYREEVDGLIELIVRECVKKSVEICMDRFQGDCWKNNKEDIEALRCSQAIQRMLPKYFGVEE